MLAFALLLVGTGAATPPAAAQMPAGIDYDLDDDGLLEIRTLAQLDAIRYNGAAGLIIGVGYTPPPGSPLIERDRKFRLAFPNAIQADYRVEDGLRYRVPPHGCGYGAADVQFDGLCNGYELANDLDFDTNGDGEITAADGPLSWGAGPRAGKGWDPIPAFPGNFQGNGYTISNMMINSDDHHRVGLFEQMGNSDLPRVVDGLRMVNVDITAKHSYDLSGPTDGDLALRAGAVTAETARGANLRNCSATGAIVTSTSGTGAPTRAGGLVGQIVADSAIAASWADVDITATSTTTTETQESIGGLVGESGQQITEQPVARITASYALGDLSSAKANTGPSSQPGVLDASQVGGLVGYAIRTNITASYAYGQVTNEVPAEHLGGLIGSIGATVTVTDSYWDRESSGFDDSADPPEEKSTADLQGPTGYAGIYADWDVDVDNADGDNNPATGVDDPWDFGTAAQYPALKGPIVARGDDLTVFSGAEVTLKAGLVRDIRGNPTRVSAAGATYAWRQVGGDDVMLSATDVAEPTFIAPTGLAEAITLTFAVTITPTGGAAVNDLLDVTVNPAQPNELISLTVTAGGNERPLTPAFASSRRSFDTYVGAYTGRAEIVMTPSDTAATISFNRDAPAAGERTETVSLAEGHNRFTITVNPPPADGDDAADDAEPLEPVTYHLNIRRQRTPKLAFNPPHYLLMNEGETATYTVELDTRWLGAEVIINISSDNPDITVSPDTVSISQYDWSERTIEVTAAKDADGDDDYATIRHIANGGHYNNVGGRLRVEVADDDIIPTPTPAPTPTPTPAPTPTPTPGPTPPPVASADRTTELVLDGRTVTITREAGALLGASVSLPSRLTRDLTITYAPMIPGLPLSSARYGLGATPEARAGTTLTVVGVPSGGLELCLPVPAALASEAGARPLTLVRYEGVGWNALPGAVHRATEVCAPNISSGVFAAAYTIPQLGPASDLTVAAGDTAGTLVLRWTPGNDATHHWVAGIKQSDLDAGDMSSSLIWTAASGADTHTVSGLDSGAEYVFAVAAGRGAEWSGWTGLARGTPN